MKSHRSATKQKTSGRSKSGGRKGGGGASLAQPAARAPAVESRYESNDALEDMMAALELLASTSPS